MRSEQDSLLVAFWRSLRRAERPKNCDGCGKARVETTSTNGVEIH
jgi:hypothetical protein